MKFVQLCSIQHFRKSTIHPWQPLLESIGRTDGWKPAHRPYAIAGYTVSGVCWEIIREPQQRAGRPIWAIAAIPLVQFV